MFKYYLRCIAHSFYNPAVYQAAIKTWQGIGGLYVLLVSAIIAFYLTILLGIGMNMFVRNELPYILHNMPRIDIKDNVLTVQGPQPVILQSANKTLTIEIDTIASPVEVLGKTSQIVVGKNMIYVKQDNDRYRSFPVEGVELLTLTPEKVKSFFEQLNVFLIVAWPVMTLGQFLNIYLLILIVTLCSYAVTAPMKEEYDLKTRVRLCALGATPAVLISKLMLTLFIHKSALWFEVLVALLYFYVMIMMIRRLNSDGKTARPTA